MARIDQRDALGVLTKPRLFEIAGALRLDHAQGDRLRGAPEENAGAA